MMIKKITISACLYSLLAVSTAFSQSDLLGSIEDKQDKPKGFTIATFKTTRLVNVHTLETVGKRTLDFRISHRFGSINSGSENFWGLDGPANIKLSLEYSYDGRLMAGFGRSSYEKLYDGFLKFRLLRQTLDNKMPVSVTLFTSAYYTAQDDPNKEINGYDKYEYTSSRFSYVHQIIIGRKFTHAFSFQLAPVFVHYNLIEKLRDKNDMYAISAASRLKFTKRMAIAAEYTYRINKDYSENTYYNSFGVGLEIETGGHVFQIHLTNSFGISDNQYIPFTTTKWDNVGIRLGFNISRVFTL